MENQQTPEDDTPEWARSTTYKNIPGWKCVNCGHIHLLFEGKPKPVRCTACTRRQNELTGILGRNHG